MRRIIALLAIIVMVWIVLKRDNLAGTAIGNGATSAASGAQRAPAVPPSPSTPVCCIDPPTWGNNAGITGAKSGKGFRDKAHFDEHFAKHGAEFAGLTKAQYLAAAQTLRDAPAGGNVLEIVRSSDGVVSRFDKRSGAFLAFDRDGTIRTFFKPNDGEKYFRRQANRAPGQ